MDLAHVNSPLPWDAPLCSPGFILERELPWISTTPVYAAVDKRHGPALRSLEVRVGLRLVEPQFRAQVGAVFEQVSTLREPACLKVFELIEYEGTTVLSHEYLAAVPLLQFLESCSSRPRLLEVSRQLVTLREAELRVADVLQFEPSDLLLGEDGTLRFDTAEPLFRGIHCSNSLACDRLLALLWTRLRRPILTKLASPLWRFAFIPDEAGISPIHQESLYRVTRSAPIRPHLLAHTFVSLADDHQERTLRRHGSYVLIFLAFYSLLLLSCLALFSASSALSFESEEEGLRTRAPAAIDALSAKQDT